MREELIKLIGKDYMSKNFKNIVFYNIHKRILFIKDADTIPIKKIKIFDKGHSIFDIKNE